MHLAVAFTLFAGSLACVELAKPPKLDDCWSDALKVCEDDSDCGYVSFMPKGFNRTVVYSPTTSPKLVPSGAAMAQRMGSGKWKWFACQNENNRVNLQGTTCQPEIVGECSATSRKAKRRVAAWEPTGVEGTYENTWKRLHHYRNMYTEYTTLWAFWNNKYTSKCGTSNVNGLCGRSWDKNVTAVNAAARSYGYDIIPLVETCCVCVLNESYDYRPAVDTLLRDAVLHNFSGYSLDMVCGGDLTLAAKRQSFLTYFKEQAVKALGSDFVVSWWAHSSDGPWESFPNGADYVYDMDTYYYPSITFAGAWAHIFQCQAGLGFEWPTREPLDGLKSMFKYLLTQPTLRAVGTWGLFHEHSSDPKHEAELEVFVDGLTAFRNAP